MSHRKFLSVAFFFHKFPRRRKWKDMKLDLGLSFLLKEWKSLLRPQYLKEDALSGITVACVALPLSFAIALASGVEPAVGLVTAIVTGIVSSLFGGTPLAVSGPAAAMAVLVATQVQHFGVERMIFITMLVGILQVVCGVLGLGRYARLIPDTVIEGFTAGIGAIILVGQLPRALGLPPPPDSEFFSVLGHVVEMIPATHLPVLGTTLFSLFLILRLPKYAPRLPAPLIAVVLSSILAVIFTLPVPRIGAIPGSLPSPVLPTIPADWLPLAIAALTVFALASIETLLSSQAVDRLTKGKPHDSNQELIGQGLGNFCASLFQGIPATSVIARSATNVAAGGKTQRACVIHSLTLLGAVYLFSSWMSQIPIASLAGVLISIAMRLLSPAPLRHLWVHSRFNAAVYLSSFAVVVAVDLIAGVVIGTALHYVGIKFRKKS